MNKKSLLTMGCLLIIFIASAMTLLAHDNDLPPTPDNADVEVIFDYTPTYYQHIQPILQTNCVSCHLEGEIGYEVFSMEDPDEIIASARDIQLVVNTGYMPPWPPSESSPHYLYERTLTDEEKANIVAWVAAGAPAGDPATAVTAEVVATVPPIDADLTLQMPEPYSPNPDISDDYRCFMIDLGFTEDTYITGYDIIPDNTATVHHTILFLASEAQRAEAEAKNGADGKPGWSCYGATGLTSGSLVNADAFNRIVPLMNEFGGLSGLQQLLASGNAVAEINAAIEANPEGELATMVAQSGGTRILVALLNRSIGIGGGFSGINIGSVGSWVPGNQPTHFPEGSGMLIPAGSFIVMQMHYNTLGGTDPDQSTIVLSTSTSDEIIAIQNQLLMAPVEVPCPTDIVGESCERNLPSVETFLTSDVLLSLCGQTPADYGNQDGEIVSSYCDMIAGTTGWAISINNHMHGLGRVTRTTLNPDTPDEQIMIDIQDWDFHWQGSYWFAEPIWVEAGDVFRVTCAWDNSVSRDNPEPRYVFWGESTSDEMCLSSVAIFPAEVGTPPPTQIASIEVTDTNHDIGAVHNQNTPQDMPIDLSNTNSIPEVFLSVTPDPLGGYLVRVQTVNFTFAPQNAGLAHRNGEGHAHLYVNGEKVSRIYGEWFYLNALPVGENTLTVTLNSNTHAPLYVDGMPISATVMLDIIE